MEIQSYLLAAGVDNTTKRNDAATIDGAFAELLKGQTPEEMLHEAAGDGVEGLMKWKIRELQKKITEQVMGSKGLTAEEIAAMSPEKRITMEKQIMDEVQQKLMEAMREEMERKNKTTLGFAPVADTTMGAMLSGQEFFGL